MGVKVNFHLSSKLTGTSEGTHDIELDEDMSLREFLRILGERYPVFTKNLLPSLDSRMKIPLLILINSKSSSLEQTVRPEDNIDIYLIGAGG